MTPKAAEEEAARPVDKRPSTCGEPTGLCMCLIMNPPHIILSVNVRLKSGKERSQEFVYFYFYFFKRQRMGRREREVDLFYLSMHSLVASCMCAPSRGIEPPILVCQDDALTN